MNVSVNSFVRGPMLSLFGPQKPKAEPEPVAKGWWVFGRNTDAADAKEEAQRVYTTQREVFVYNTKAVIANITLVTTILAVAAIASGVLISPWGVAMAALSGIMCADAKHSLPRIELETTRWAAYGSPKAVQLAIRGDLKHDYLARESAEDKFNLPTRLFLNEDGTRAWTPWAFAIFEQTVLFNRLPKPQEAPKPA